MFNFTRKLISRVGPFFRIDPKLAISLHWALDYQDMYGSLIHCSNEKDTLNVVSLLITKEQLTNGDVLSAVRLQMSYKAETNIRTSTERPARWYFA